MVLVILVAVAPYPDAQLYVLARPEQYVDKVVGPDAVIDVKQLTLDELEYDVVTKCVDELVELDDVQFDLAQPHPRIFPSVDLNWVVIPLPHDTQ